MKSPLTGRTPLLLLAALHISCRNPTIFKCDPVSGTDCDGGAESGGGGTAAGGGGEAGGGAGGGTSTLTVSAKRAMSRPSIDGKLSEASWDLSERISRLTMGTNNNSSTFGVLWDDTYLYVAAKVLDADLQNDSELAWADDSFEVYLDGRGERSASYDENDLHVIKGWNDSALAAFPSRATTGVLHATADIPGGYTVELAIPWANSGVTPVADEVFGFDVQQTDDDLGGEREGAHCWNATHDTNFESTASFGFLRLSSEIAADAGTGGGGGATGGGEGGGGGNPQQTWAVIPIRTAAQKRAGLAGGEGFQQITEIEYAPSNPNVVYFISDAASVWKSSDSGTTWKMKHSGIRISGGNTIAISPVDENVVLVTGGPTTSGSVTYSRVAHGIYKTSNGGESWKQVLDANYFVYTPTLGGQLSFATPTTVYASTLEKGLWKSTDTGDTWTVLDLVALRGDTLGNVQAHPDDGSVVFVASSTDEKLYKLSGGSSLVEVGAGLPRGAVLGLQVRGNHNGNANDDVMYVTVGDQGCYKSTDSGATFVAANGSPLALLPVGGRSWRFLAVSPSNADYVYAAMFESTQVFSSSDGGRTWHPQASADVSNVDGWIMGSLIENSQFDRGLDYYFKPIAVHPTIPTTALSAGARKTTDGGSHWRYSNTGYTGGLVGWSDSVSEMSSISFDRNNPDRFAFFLMDMGPFITVNGGDTFQHMTPPHVMGGISTLGGALDWTSNTVIAAVGNWDQRAIAIARDATAVPPHWKLFPETLAHYSYYFVATHPTQPQIAYAGRYRFDNIRTSDTYATLQKTVRAMFPGNGDVVYALEYVSETSTRLYRSDDQGRTWTDKTYGNPTLGYSTIPAKVNSGRTLGQFAVHPTDRDRLFVPDLYKGVYAIDGATLTVINEAHGLAKSVYGTVDAQNVAIDPVMPNVMYVGYSNYLYGLSSGVFRSQDGGRSWTNITYNLGEGFTVQYLTVHPKTREIYVGSHMGTWKLPPPE